MKSSYQGDDSSLVIVTLIVSWPKILGAAPLTGNGNTTSVPHSPPTSRSENSLFASALYNLRKSSRKKAN